MNKQIKNLAGAAALASMLFLGTAACDNPDDDKMTPVPSVVTISPSVEVEPSPSVSVSVSPSVSKSVYPSVDPDDCDPDDEGCPDLPGDGR